jgi:hypothetical protein
VPSLVKKAPISILTLAVIFYDIPFEVLSSIFVTASANRKQGVFTPFIILFLRHHLSEQLRGLN